MTGTDERIVVVGAGAAGIAAARLLHDAGRDVLLVEARDRIGGRAESFALPGGAMLDRGCSWLHSARRNPWTDVARARGLTIETQTANWSAQWRDLGFPQQDQYAFAAARERMDAAAHAALGGPDRPLAAFVPTDDPWRPLLEAISGYANGAGLAYVSLHDWARYEDAATADNWAVREGYGTLVAGYAAGVPHRLSTPVTRIDHRAGIIRVETPAGTIEAARVVVAVPTTVLADPGGLAFDPPLPAKHDAAAALPLGVADKAFLAVAGAVDWPHDAHLIGDPRRAETASYRLSPFGLPVIEAYFGGDFAIEMEGEAACAFAIDELVRLLGGDWRRRLSPVTATSWHREPHIRGSYSHARVGHAAARAVLAAPVDARLFFAGEACSPTDFSTAHGAYASGIAAARAILAS